MPADQMNPVPSFADDHQRFEWLCRPLPAAWCKGGAGSTAAAVAAWLAVLRQAPMHRDALLHLAAILHEAGEAGIARKLLKRRQQLEPESSDNNALLWHVDMLVEAEDEPGACGLIKKSIIANETALLTAPVLQRYVRLLMSAGEHEEALAALTQFDGMIYPDDSWHEPLLRARCLFAGKHFDAADTALASLGNSPEMITKILEERINGYTRANIRRQWLALLQELNKAELAAPLQHYLRGCLHYRLGDARPAIAEFRLAQAQGDGLRSRIWELKALVAAREYGQVEHRVDEWLQTVADPLTAAKLCEAAGLLFRAEKVLREGLDKRPTRERLTAMFDFYFRHRWWGKAWAIAQKMPHTRHIAGKLKEIRAAANLYHIALDGDPESYAGFMSSERTFTAMVDKVHKWPRKPRAGTNSIAVIISSLGSGGAERQCVNLVNGLAATREFDTVHLLCTNLTRLPQDSFYLPLIDRDNVVVREYFDRNTPLKPADIPALRPIARELRFLQPDGRLQMLLHMATALAELQPRVIHAWLDDSFIFAALLGSLLGIPVVGRWGSRPPGIERNGSEADAHKTAWLAHAYSKLGALPGVCYSANARMTADEYADFLGLPHADVHVVYNGIDFPALDRSERTVAQLRSELGFAADARVMGTVFRFTEEKRPFLWVEVASRLRAQHPDLRFVMVGEGPLREPVAAYARELAVDIHFAGRQECVGDWYRLFSVFLLTSAVEGVSNSVIEAQASGNVVIVPDVGGLPEVVDDGNNGLLLRSPDRDAFVAAISGLLDDPQRAQKISTAAQQHARSMFQPQRMVADYIRLYRLAMARQKTPKKKRHRIDSSGPDSAKEPR